VNLTEWGIGLSVKVAPNEVKFASILGSGLHSVIYGEPTKSSLKFIRNKIHPTGLQWSALCLAKRSLRSNSAQMCDTRHTNAVIFQIKNVSKPWLNLRVSHRPRFAMTSYFVIDKNGTVSEFGWVCGEPDETISDRDNTRRGVALHRTRAASPSSLLHVCLRRVTHGQSPPWLETYRLNLL